MSVPRLDLYTYSPDAPRSDRYSVRINGRDAFVYHAAVADLVAFSSDGPVQVEIVTAAPVKTAIVRPLSSKVAALIDGSRIVFDLDRPMNLCIEVDGQIDLFMYASPIEADVPSPGDPRVRYFGAGKIHDVGQVELQSGETMYIEGGAVVRGAIRAANARDVSVKGRGLIDGSGWSWEKGRPRSVLFESCDGINIEGVAIVNSRSWTLVFRGCTDVLVDNLKEITDGSGTDGIDIVSCRSVVVRDSMLRNGDDCVVIKAFDNDNTGRETDVDNVLVERCALLNVGAGNALEIGHELRTTNIRNITFRDCDIVCVHGHGAAISIHNTDRAVVSDVLYEDIRVEHYFTYLVEIKVMKSRWGHDPERGHIQNITLRRIAVTQSPYNEGYSISVIGGVDPGHRVEGVVMQDLYFDERKIMDADAMDLFVRNASGVVFR